MPGLSLAHFTLPGGNNRTPKRAPTSGKKVRGASFLLGKRRDISSREPRSREKVVRGVPWGAVEVTPKPSPVDDGDLRQGEDWGGVQVPKLESHISLRSTPSPATK